MATAPPAAVAYRTLSTWLFAGLLLLHMVLASAEKGSSLLVQLHALAALAAGLIIGTDPHRPERTVQAVAYLCGAEVLWRMCDPSGALPWEFAKYSVIAVMVVSLVRRRKASGLPIIYFALLVPSAALTVAQLGLSARQALAGSLSGPLALAVAMACMARLRLTLSQLCDVFLWHIVPLAGMAYLCYSATFGAAEVSFGASSSTEASGGFGPNQVSALLGFGIVCALLCFFFERRRFAMKVLLALLMLWFAVQSGLTFSRTGLYLAGISGTLVVVPLLGNSRTRWTVIGLAAVIFVLAQFIVLPLLDSFTGGALQERFRNRSLTHRDVLVVEQLKIWMSNPVLGAGPGVTDRAHSSFGYRSHTEYTRLVAEHGVFGLAALIALLVAVFKMIRHVRTSSEKALCFAMATFGLLFMAVSATRLAVVGLTLGLASVRIAVERSRGPCARSQAYRLHGSSGVFLRRSTRGVNSRSTRGFPSVRTRTNLSSFTGLEHEGLSPEPASGEGLQ